MINIPLETLINVGVLLHHANGVADVVIAAKEVPQLGDRPVIRVSLDNIGFDIINGVVACENCKDENFISIPNSVFAAICHIIYQDEKKMFSFKINEQSEKILGEVCEKYLLAQTEKNYNTLDFYKQMRI